jgi:UDPglucose--hexose-1-phosphate uridylyltransferase
MSTFRLDPISKDAVVFAPERNKRPIDGWSSLKPASTKCPFCPGNEHLTPADTFYQKDNFNKWTIRSFPNKYPAFTEPSEHISGIQEVIVESVSHDVNMGHYTRGHLVKVLKAYKNRIASLKSVKNIKYIVVFKNHGFFAGASLEHPHSQVVGIDFVPKAVNKKLKRLKKFYNKTKKCYLCSPDHTKNKIYENSLFIAFVPESVRFAYECWIVPKDHKTYYEQSSHDELNKLAEIILKVFKAVNKCLGFPPFNLIINTGFLASHRSYFHWNIQLIPKTAQFAGFELATGIYINQINPGHAANQLKTYLDK